MNEISMDKTTYKPDVAIVITTFDRRDLLRGLLKSIRDLTIKPAAVFLCDNENSPKTREIAEEFGVDHYVAMADNTGGAGGFSRGIEEAYRAGHEWLWIMDDDVAVLPYALEKMGVWMQKTEDDLRNGKPIADTVGVYQGLKYNWDGSFFYWQYHFWNKLGIPNPVAPSAFAKDETSREMNTMCFEGGLVNREVVKQIGLPDARFFIYWDDTLYGYLASKKTQMRIMTDYIMRRTREIPNIKIGSVRKLNSTGNLSRYHIMRNRGHMAHYLRENGDYNPFVFQFGTFLTFCKECIRLFVSNEGKTGFDNITRGMSDGRKIRRNKHWRSYNDIHPLNAA